MFFDIATAYPGEVVVKSYSLTPTQDIRLDLVTPYDKREYITLTPVEVSTIVMTYFLSSKGFTQK